MHTSEASSLFIIREAQPRDAIDILKTTRDWSLEPEKFGPLSFEDLTETPEEQAQTIREIQKQDNAIMLVAVAKGCVVADLLCKGYPFKDIRHNAELSLTVRKEWRRKGVGEALIRTCIQWAEHHPFLRRLELCTYAENKGAQALYTKLGFTLEGTRKGFVHQNGQYSDDLLMALYLPEKDTVASR